MSKPKPLCGLSWQKSIHSSSSSARKWVCSSSFIWFHNATMNSYQFACMYASFTWKWRWSLQNIYQSNIKPTNERANEPNITFYRGKKKIYLLVRLFIQYILACAFYFIFLISDVIALLEGFLINRRQTNIISFPFWLFDLAIPLLLSSMHASKQAIEHGRESALAHWLTLMAWF